MSELEKPFSETLFFCFTSEVITKVGFFLYVVENLLNFSKKVALFVDFLWVTISTIQDHFHVTI